MEFAAGDVGGQVHAAALIDEVRIDVVLVVVGSGKRYFGSVGGRRDHRSLEDMWYGARAYEAADLEGHQWHFQESNEPSASAA